LDEVQQVRAYRIEPWRSDPDATAFSSGMDRIDRYIKEQAERDMSSRVSLVFVLLEPGSNVVRGFYSLSAFGIVFDELPKNVRRRMPRYPQASATLLGRLGVDRAYKARLKEETGETPRLGELLFIDAQKRALQGAISSVGSALMVIDVLMPTESEIANGVCDPMGFYVDFGFVTFPGNDRRVYKTMRTIADEYGQANEASP
jgi:hypothetical protein